MELIPNLEPLRISLKDIEKATENFTTLIGKGGFGNVYKGELSLLGKVTTVAVKRLVSGIGGHGHKEFLMEINLLSRYKHPNLVSLLGFCQEGNERILIYEYAEHGSFDKFLCMDNAVCPLTCKQKIKICIDAACGLDYLHNHVAKNQRVIHRDIKSANILLGHNWKAMISDFGLSILGRANEYETFVITNPCGTLGYWDPSYIDTGVLTKESDVYSFGVVLFEALCGRLSYKINNEKMFLGPLARRCYEERKLHEIVDPAMMEQLHLGSFNRISKIAYQCLNVNREKRPSMGFVVKELKEALEVQEILEGSPTEEELSRIYQVTPFEHNSDEEDATSRYMLQEKARKETRMHDHDAPNPVLEIINRSPTEEGSSRISHSSTPLEPNSDEETAKLLKFLRDRGMIERKATGMHDHDAQHYALEIIGGSPTEEGSSRISHSTPLEPNSDEEDAMLLKLLRDRAMRERKATGMHDHDAQHYELEADDILEMIPKILNKPPSMSDLSYLRRRPTSPDGPTGSMEP